MADAFALLPEAAALPALVSPVLPLLDAVAFVGALTAPLDFWELCARRCVPPHTNAAHTIPIAIL